MSNPNPLIPQGSLLEQQAKSKPHLRIALCIVAVHLVFLGGLLMQGCKPDATTTTDSAKLLELPPMEGADTNVPGATSTNLALDAGPAAAPAPGVAQPGTPPSGLPPMGGAVPGAQPPLVTQPPSYVEPVPAVAAAQEYTVVKGDTFSSIGRKFGVSPGAVAAANPGVDSTRLQIGQKLQIPAPTSVVAPARSPFGAAPAATDMYTVKSGDTLSKIARNHATTVAAIKELNNLRTDRINVGQKLKLPPRASAAEVPAATSPTGTFPTPAPFRAPAGTSPQ